MSLQITDTLRRGRLAFLVVGVAFLLLALFVYDPGNVQFQVIDWTKFATLLLPYLLVALLIERTVEVVFGITREPEQRERAAKEEAFRKALATLKSSDATDQTGIARAQSLLATYDADVPPPGGNALVPAKPLPVAVAEKLAEVEREQSEAETKDTAAAFYWSMALGLLAAWLGFRLLTSVLIDPQQSWPRLSAAVTSATGRSSSSPQAGAPAAGATSTTAGKQTAANPDTTRRDSVNAGTGTPPATTTIATTTPSNPSAPAPIARTDSPAANANVASATAARKPARRPPVLFVLLDIVLTACLLSGGADGVHHITSVMSKYLEGMRKRAEENVRV